MPTEVVTTRNELNNKLYRDFESDLDRLSPG